MPPHCDSIDGPVVNAARDALEQGDVALVLPFVPVESEQQVRDAFDRALPVRQLGPAAKDTADRLFFETVVRLHRAGEGAPYTGLKPAGLSRGPAIPLAEEAIETGKPDELSGFLAQLVRDEIDKKLVKVEELSATRNRSVSDAREYVEAMLDFEVFSHHLYLALTQSSGH